MMRIKTTLAILALCIVSGLAANVSYALVAADIIGQWELARVEYADGKGAPPAKPKMGGAEFFKDQTVLFSDGLRGKWAILEHSRIEIELMEFLLMSGSIQGELLKLTTEVNPNEILVLKKK